MHSGGFELTKLTYTKLEDDLIRHWGDRLTILTTSCLSDWETRWLDETSTWAREGGQEFTLFWRHRTLASWY